MAVTNDIPEVFGLWPSVRNRALIIAITFAIIVYSLVSLCVAVSAV